jgi:thioester reductase-like protein
MKDLEQRIANLSSEQRKLLLMRLKQQTDRSKTTDRHTTTPYLDLKAEAVLDPTIYPKESLSKFPADPKSVFLTGGTGFLGAFLIEELLQNTKADIYCLVRADNAESGFIRLQKNLQRYGLWNDKFGSRIIPVLGDLSQPNLGLSLDNYNYLAEKVNTIYHSGALLNYMFPYPAFKQINVLGTEEILRLACQITTKPVHYISSIAVFESSAYAGKVVTEDDLLDNDRGIYLGYSQSKWVAEKLVSQARDRGLPVTIYRPPLIGAHSQTGTTNTDDFICRMFKGYIQMGYVPDLDYLVDTPPVDYVSRAVVYLSKQPQSLGKAFNLQHPQPLHWRDYLDLYFSVNGFPIPIISLDRWQEKLKEQIGSEEHPLYTLQPFLLDRLDREQFTMTDLYMQNKRPQVSCKKTLAALAGSGIICPPIDSQYIEKCLSYLIESEFLNVEELSAFLTFKDKVVFSHE